MSRPPDWPSHGAIDLAVHDLPHASSSTEWWYLNAHLGGGVSLFAAFFRIRKESGWAHSAAWALSDPSRKLYLSDSRVDSDAPRMGLARIKSGRGSRDARLNKAMAEVLERGSIPAPDRVFEGHVSVALDALSLDFGGLKLAKEGASYRLQLQGARASCDLVFTPQKPPVRHGDDGLVRGPQGEQMFYYFIPRCSVEGTLSLDGDAREAVGSGWYDHEFGWRAPEPGAEAQEPAPDIAWNWLSAQLDDGTDVSAYSLVRVEDSKVLHQWTIVSDPGGQRAAHTGAGLVARNTWRSLRTFFDYPTQWSLQAPGLQLEIDAAFHDQEFVTVISKPAFWEGRVALTGTRDGKPVQGLGYVEISGFEHLHSLDDFFGAVGEEVRKSVARVLPLEPSHEETQQLIAAADRPQYMDGVDTATIGKSLIAPIREIADRGGKSWRSYAALACCDVVGGDSRKYTQWLAMPELLHVGSLIVDDIEDGSDKRRGGPACHKVFGEPVAINAGTAAYFLTQKLMFDDSMPAAHKLRLYDLYFEAMRAGHAGQALDLAGLHELMPAAVESGSGQALERRILATHRLKTAAPAAALARMGAVVGGGSVRQIEAVGRFFEALGLAFQIMDDVLNLRGFKNDLKTRAEDVQNGVVTLPVAKALSRLDAAQRQWLWTTLRGKPTDPRILSAVVELLETCGAISACAAEARELVESAWAVADPLLDDSLSKVMLRAFGWYILDRHY